MNRNDLDLLELVGENISVRKNEGHRTGELVVDIYRDRKNGRYYQVQPPMQGNLYRVTSGAGEFADYGSWQTLKD